MRKEIRKLLIERMNDLFNDKINFTNLGTDLNVKDVNKSKRKRRKNVELHGFTIIAKHRDAKFKMYFAYFDSIFVMEKYMSDWEKEASLDDYSILVTDHFNVKNGDAIVGLLKSFTDADVIKVIDYTDDLFTRGKSFKESTRIHTYDKPPLTTYELFNTDIESNPRGYYTITKKGDLTWQKT